MQRQYGLTYKDAAHRLLLAEVEGLRANSSAFHAVRGIDNSIVSIAANSLALPIRKYEIARDDADPSSSSKAEASSSSDADKRSASEADDTDTDKETDDEVEDADVDDETEDTDTDGEAEDP